MLGGIQWGRARIFKAACLTSQKHLMGPSAKPEAGLGRPAFLGLSFQGCFAASTLPPAKHPAGHQTYRVRIPLQKHIDGSVHIPVAVMQGDHALILILACNVNQLQREKKAVTSVETVANLLGSAASEDAPAHQHKPLSSRALPCPSDHGAFK